VAAGRQRDRLFIELDDALAHAQPHSGGLPSAVLR
jgi:hypothetical protein